MYKSPGPKIKKSEFSIVLIALLAAWEFGFVYNFFILDFSALFSSIKPSPSTTLPLTYSATKWTLSWVTGITLPLVFKSIDAVLTTSS